MEAGLLIPIPTAKIVNLQCMQGGDKTKKKAPPPVGTPSFSPVKPGNRLTAEPSYITAIGTLMEKQREGTNVR